MTTGRGSVDLVTAASAPVSNLFRVLSDERLRKNFIAGLAASIIAMVIVFGGLLWGAFSAVDATITGDGFFAEALAFFLKTISVALSLIISPLLFTVAASIIGATWVTAAFELGRELAGGDNYPERSAGVEAGLALRSIGWELRRLVRFLVFAILFALLAVIPVIGFLAIAAEFLLAAYALTWELFAPHFEGIGLGYRQQLSFLRRRPGLWIGFGSVALLLLLVPFAQPLVLHGNNAAAGSLSARM